MKLVIASTAKAREKARVALAPTALEHLALDEEEDIWSTERCRRRLATAVDLIDRGNNAKGQDFL